MATTTDSILIKMGAGSTRSGVEVVNLAAQFLSLFDALQAHFNALHQLSHLGVEFTVPAEVYGTVDPLGATSAATAQALYNELNSLLSGTGPHAVTIRQFCAKLKQ